MIRFEAGLLAEELSRDLHSWCWMVDGQLLRSHCYTGLEAGLLPHGIQIATQFFPLRKGDLVLLKDAQAGGPGRDRLALVQCFREARGTDPAVIMASGFYAPTTIGMKLPPIPLRTNGELNEAVMAALGPCGPRLNREIQAQDRIRELAFKKAFTHLWTGRAIADEIQGEKKELQRQIADLPDGEVTTELTVAGELIRLKLEVEDSVMHFNFTGTTPGKVHALPLTATSGIVRSTVREWLRWPSALSSACSSLISITTPTGCMLNAPSKNTCDEKLSASSGLLRTVVEAALHKWDRRATRGMTNYFDAKATLLFTDAAPFTLSIPTGSPANEAVEGLSFFDQRALGMGFSPERFEMTCPVLVERLAESEREAKTGKVTGGPGLQLAFRVLKSGKLIWDEPPPFKITLKKNQTPPLPSEIEVLRGKEKLSMSAAGSFDLHPNDIVTMKSGSGGGLV